MRVNYSFVASEQNWEKFSELWNVHSFDLLNFKKRNMCTIYYKSMRKTEFIISKFRFSHDESHTELNLVRRTLNSHWPGNQKSQEKLCIFEYAQLRILTDLNIVEIVRYSPF